MRELVRAWPREKKRGGREIEKLGAMVEIEAEAGLKNGRELEREVRRRPMKCNHGCERL